jgi:hypothetical protein
VTRLKARQRYNLGILLFSVGYAFALFGGEGYFSNHPGANGFTAYAAAVIPALMIVGMFFTIGRYLVDEQDEYQRMLMVRQSLVASGVALSVATVWGFLESFDLAPHVDAYWVAVLWFGGLGFGACVNKIVERGA